MSENLHGAAPGAYTAPEIVCISANTFGGFVGKTGKSIGVVALVALVAYAAFQYRETGVEPEARGKLPTPSIVSTVKPQIADVPSNRLPITNIQTAVSGRPMAVTQNPFFQIMKSPGGLAQAFRKLESLQNAPDARYFMGYIATHCSNYSAEMEEAVSKHIREQSSGTLRDQRLAALAARMKDCAGVPRVDGQKFYLEAADAGSAKAIAYQLVNKPPFDLAEVALKAQQAQALAALQDPAVLSELAAYFNNRNNGYVWRLPNIDGDIQGSEIADAMRLAACDLGDDCSPQSYLEQINCYRNSLCGMDRATRYQQALYSPEAFARVNLIREQILVGVRLNTWPDGFWFGNRKGR